MSATWDVLATRVVVEAGVNDVIRYATNGGALASKTVAAGTYYLLGDGADLLSAVVTAINASNPTVSASVSYSTTPGGAGGVLVSVALGTATSFRFNPDDALNTFPLGALGIFADTGNITSSVLSSGYTWVSNQPTHLVDPVSKRRRVSQTITKSGAVYSFASGARITRRRFRFDHVEPYRVWVSSTPNDEGRAFERYGDTLDGGEMFRLYRLEELSPQILNTPTASEIIATYVADLSGGYVFDPARIEKGGPLFAFEFDAIEVTP